MTQKYAHYQLEDFVQDDSFVRWVTHPDADSERFWAQVVEAYPYQQETIRKASLAVQQLAFASRETFLAGDVDEIWEKVAAGLDGEVTSMEPSIRRMHWGVWVAAASVLLIISLGWWYQPLVKSGPTMYQGLVKEAGSGLVEVVNRQQRPMIVRFPDGSTAQLAQNSRLSYSRSFSGPQREVFLSGEAFFKVSKDPARPFLVYANELVTKVLGTSFGVKAFDKDQEVLVSVRTGRVSVYEHQATGHADPETTGIVLVPNQKAVYRREEGRLSRTLVENPAVVIVEESGKQALTFSETPVTQIFKAIEQAYGVDIVYDEEVLQTCLLTTTLGDESLYQKLAVVCKGIDASYKVVDAQIVITSQGCK